MPAARADAEDGNISSSLKWTSSIDGLFWTGASFSYANLSLGTHTITAAVTDSGGLTGSASITVNMTAPVNITLTATGYKQKGSRYANLSWSGATTKCRYQARR